MKRQRKGFSKLSSFMLAKSSPIFMQCAQTLLTTHLTTHSKPGMKQFLKKSCTKGVVFGTSDHKFNAGNKMATFQQY